MLFDDGDEVVIEDAHGMPVDIVVADQTGTFVDYLRDLEDSAAVYARPINRRWQSLADAEGFAEAYLDAFEERFRAFSRNTGNAAGPLTRSSSTSAATRAAVSPIVGNGSSPACNGPMSARWRR